MSEEKKGSPISGVEGVMMVAVAAVYDAVQAVLTWLLVGLLLNWVVTVWAWLTFFLWFQLRGVSFASPKRLMTFFGATFFEMVPALNSLPAWTLAIVLSLIFLRAESAIPALKQLDKIAHPSQTK